MAYEVIIKAPAQRDLDSLPEKEVIRIARRLAQLQQNPRPVGVQKLTDQEGYRIRIGDYRVLYLIDDQKEQIQIYRIKHRKDAYR